MDQTTSVYYPWSKPEGVPRAGLVVANSLTGAKTEFIPSSGGNFVNWYICGPTVYDSAHLGHASNYVRFDIVRRLLSDYFGYDVFVQMNITDIDDKIIKRASERGVSVEEISKEFEKEFLEDMESLNVRPADVITRVSEYVPEIVEYIEIIMENGFAYESGGSVYFDTIAFIDKGHDYGKLEPWSVGKAALLAEGEGVLTANDPKRANEKKCTNDFVLWKKSKEGEPTWPSPWGPGRPGWHIECSAMASNVLGPVIDIHAGGEDLRFPHHSNEIAQAEAHQNCHQWVNYFLHSGHLHIDGLKMSKSLKNFISIRNCLRRYNARQLRLFFLGHKYDAPMNYSENSMQEAVKLDRTFIDFFGSLKAELRDRTRKFTEGVSDRPGPEEQQLSDELKQRQREIHSLLANNFDTPGAMRELQNLITAANSYIASSSSSSNITVLESVGRYLTKMFTVFGLTPLADQTCYGDNSQGAEGQSREEIISPLLNAFAEFRDSVRRIGREQISTGGKELLELSDRIRDEVLPQLGIRLEDRADRPAIWKLEDSEELMMEIRRKKEEENARILEKERLKAERRAKEKEELNKGRLAPEVLFKEDPEYCNRFKEYDSEGMPITYATGEPVPKSARRTLEKARKKQQKLHEKYLNAVRSGVIAN